MLFDLVTAANFMDIKAMLDLTCLAVSVLIKVSYIYIYIYIDFVRSSSSLDDGC